MSLASNHRWHEGQLWPLTPGYQGSDPVTADSPIPAGSLVAADSWLVRAGTTLGLDLHRSRFLAASASADEGAEFWTAAIAAIPHEGDWFPRVELRRSEGREEFFFRLRHTPALERSVVLATHTGVDPRLSPTTKGPDLDALLAVRSLVQPLGAGEAVILSSAGWVVEGAYSALLWWRGDVLCSPSPELSRVASVTARSVITVATALGIDVLYESATPADLDGLEIWAVNSLHGIRLVTGWIGGPAPAERPGRLGMWRSRLDLLRRALPAVA